MRNHDFLKSELEILLNGAFHEMDIVNPIEIKFGRRAKRRFGSIKMNKQKQLSQITINGLFREDFIPEQIICATIAHELCHYAHGFGSNHVQKYKHPHQGNVILMEMKKRGLEALFRYEKEWTKKNWTKIVMTHFPIQQRKVSSRRSTRKHKHVGIDSVLEKQLRKAFKKLRFLL